MITTMFENIPLFVEKYYVVVFVISIYCALETVRGNLLSNRPKYWLKVTRGLIFHLAGYHHGAAVHNFIIRDVKGCVLDPQKGYVKVQRVIMFIKTIVILLAVVYYIMVL